MNNFNMVLSSINEKGFFIGENFFEENLVNELLLSFNNRNYSNAGIGSSKEVNANIRKDVISWIEEDEETKIVKEYLLKINDLKNELNKNFFLNVNNFEGHYAHYKNGGFYKKHVDNIQGKNSRIVTCITYFNKNWKDSDGGEVIIYDENKRIIVPPKFNTFVCFLSENVEHEVFPSNADRLSITGWFKRN